MKKILHIAALFSACVLAFNSCEEDLDKKWLNPDQYTPASEDIASGLFTTMQTNDFFMEGYGYWYYMSELNGPAGLTQVFGGMLPYSNTLSTMQPYHAYWDLEYLFGPFQDEDPATVINTSQTRSWFNNFYTSFKNYGLISDEFKLMSANDAKNNEIYLLLATALKDIGAMRTVDMFNSIPYFNAFKGSEGVFHAEYDDPKQIYESCLVEMQDISGKIMAAYDGMSEYGKSIFKAQDLFFNGDPQKWVRYVNGEILRHALRVSGVPNLAFSLSDMMQTAVNGGLIIDGAEDYTFKSRMANTATIGGSDCCGELKPRGLFENFAWWKMFPDIMMQRMNYGTIKYERGTDDPRLLVIATGFTPTENANDIEFYGTSANKIRNKKVMMGQIAGESRRFNRFPQSFTWRYDTTWNEAHDAITKIDSAVPQGVMLYSVTGLGNNVTFDRIVRGCAWTQYNAITHALMNPYYFTLQTRADIDLILAEAQSLGLVSGRAAADYVHDAVMHSCQYWYKLNNDATYAGTITPLAKAIMQPAMADEQQYFSTYADFVKGQYTAASGEDALEIIMQQKYIHLNMMNPNELFSELRRTRHPKLEPFSWEIYDNLGQYYRNKKMVVERFKYPDSEKSTNKDEYQKVQAQDTWTTPIFWATKSSQSYFMDHALKGD
jgi:hypothetical protein